MIYMKPKDAIKLDTFPLDRSTVLTNHTSQA